MHTLTKVFTVSNKLGLHARAAAQLVKTMGRFQSEVSITSRKQTINGKSIMGVLMLAASQGTKISVTVKGNDAEDVLRAFEELINNRFGEES